MEHNGDYEDEYDTPKEQRAAWRARDAINERLDDLGWNQQELVRRSGVSATTVRWLQQGEVRTYRAATLSRVSKALGWPGGALAKVLKGGTVPEFETDDPPEVHALTGIFESAEPGEQRSGPAAASGIDISDLDPVDQDFIRSEIEMLRRRRQQRTQDPF